MGIGHLRGRTAGCRDRRRQGRDRRTTGRSRCGLFEDGIVRPERYARTSEVTFDAPLRPPVVFCVGQNYADHLEEKQAVHRPEPELPKAGQTIVGPDAPAVLEPHVTTKLDYETDLGIVIGRAGRNISEQDAFDHVFGYVALNDLTARDRQVVLHPDGAQSMALGPGKNFDGSTRMGTYVMSGEDLGDPEAGAQDHRLR